MPVEREASREPSVQLNTTGTQVLNALTEVRRELGTGLPERAYVEGSVRELRGRGHEIATEVDLPICYKGERLGARCRADAIVDRAILLEFKAVETILPVHVAQTLTYLRLSACRLGYLVNFDAVPFGKGIRRFVDSSKPERPPGSRLRE